MKEKELEKIQILNQDLIEGLERELNIGSVKDLEKSAERSKVEGFKNIDGVLQDRILVNIEVEKEPSSKKLLGRVFPIVNRLIDKLKSNENFVKVKAVGDFRRKCPDFEEVNLLAVTNDVEASLDYFCNMSSVKKILARYQRKASVMREDELKVNLSIVGGRSYGATLIDQTGSKGHYDKLSEKAKEEDLVLNSEGLWKADDEKIAGESEKNVYQELEMDFVPPELREDRGEIEVSLSGDLPDLIEIQDIKGDLQLHTTFSDGENSVEEMAKKGMENGLSYLLVTDHAHYFKEDGSWSRRKLERQATEIERVNDGLDIQVLHGIEADIERDGLNIPDSWIDDVEILCAGIHGNCRDFTSYVLSSFEKYPVDIFVHPFDRTLPNQGKIGYDIEEVIEAASSEDVAIEINSQPTRLNLDWQNVKKNRENVDYVISTDAHSLNQMDYLPFGVFQARKGWCEKSNIVNSLPIDDLLDYFDS